MKHGTNYLHTMLMPALLLSVVMGGCRSSDDSSLEGVYTQGPYWGVFGYASDLELQMVFGERKGSELFYIVIQQ
ncbi:MAG: hypothetical protein HN350_15275 [Phycisphaerales bacterium]|jgi:hypothetical protein|nr:hypothetical protein [Phycisphaerales bacterium]